MGTWVNLEISAGPGVPATCRATYHSPSQEWLDALLYAVKNGIGFPVPHHNVTDQTTAVITNVDVRSEEAWGSVFGRQAQMVRVVNVEYLYEP